MPPEIRRFAQTILRKDPVEISIAISKPAEGILQGMYFVEDGVKNRLVEHLLRQQKTPDQRILIFAGTKKAVKDLNAHLRRKQFRSAEIHSDLDQKEREDTLLHFKNASVPILVATDVLSRGIDIKGIEVVINFDVPGDPEDYVHRIGRTARADATGVALTFVNRLARHKFQRIEKLMGIAVKEIPLPPQLAGTAASGNAPRNRKPEGAPAATQSGDNRRKKRRRPGGKGRPPGRPAARDNGGAAPPMGPS
jgi:ATP-dependent RNA helicase RhlE